MATIQLNSLASGGLEMQFLNGGTALLPTMKGLWICATACGAGKTTIIADLCCTLFKDGILVIVPTIAAANELSEKIANRRMILGMASLSLDVFCLHCENTKAMESYRMDPEGIGNHNVLIVTSARVQRDPIDLFLKYGSQDRKYIFIDELINFYPEPIQITGELKDIVTFVDNKKTHNGKKAIESFEEGPYTRRYKHCYQDVKSMEFAYKSSSYRYLKGSSKLNDYKMDFIFNHIVKNGLEPISYSVKDFSGKAITILFDGTADCIVAKSDKRLLRMSGKKYSSDIQFIQYPNRLRRKNNEEWVADNITVLADDFLSLAAKESQMGKVLVVTWKSIDLYRKRQSPMADDYEATVKTSYPFPDMIRSKLQEAKARMDNIEVIYRGSGQDRGSNEYRDCGVIFFLGEWRIPDDVVKDVNKYFGFSCKFTDYKKALMVQTICRLRIRQHNGQPIKVYFSEDIDNELMWSVQNYFRENSKPGCKIDGILEPCHPYSKPEKGYIYEMVRLYGYNAAIKTAIETAAPYQFTISLDDIYKILPRPRKAKDRYKNLVKYLMSRGIEMKII